MTSRRPDIHDDLADMVAALREPAAWPDPVTEVEVIQTHISVVFLAGDYVYKVKKSVDFGFLDFTTPRRRLAACQAEVRLNRRLCPDTYLGVVPIRETQAGLRFGGSAGRVVDYAVKMRRLPEHRMLDRLRPAGLVTGEMVDELAGVIARFHDRSDRDPRISRFGSPRVIARNWQENFDQTRQFVGTTL
ncbi:MAG TPA: kinase, partial [Chloroflexi bacterium]|nr:kinase [Chloroflexota bacterium]